MTFFATLFALTLVAAVLYAALRVYHNSQVFRPARVTGVLKPDPGDLGHPFEDVWLEGEAGKLHGWWLPADAEDAATLLICHGNAGNIAGRVESAGLYRELGLNVFLFDYRGYGLSAGRPTEQGLYRDADTAWNYLVRERRIAPSRVVLLGRSLGGAVATHLALTARPGAVIIESTFTSIPAMARQRYPYLPLWRLRWARFDNASRIAAIEAPLLLVHSTDDEVIPFHHGEALWKLRRDRSRLVRIAGTHSGGYIASGEAYARPICEFLQETGHLPR